ncbi:MAG: hypothetical protein CML40_01620, partial [Rhodobacteraceae bacterium]
MARMMKRNIDLLLRVGGVDSGNVKLSTRNFNYFRNFVTIKKVPAVLIGHSIFFLTACNNSNIKGTDDNDYLGGTSKSDILLGFAGDDTFQAGSGNDTFDGGADIDTVSYADAGSNVIINLSETLSQATVGDYTDTLINIENVIGSNYNDLIKDSEADNILTGGPGKDTFEITAGFNTITDLHTGDVVFVYSGATLNALVEEEFIASSETVNTGTFKLLAGDGGAHINMRSSSSGEYTLIGGSGTDLLEGGPLDDILTGGEGSDTFVITSGSDYITDLSTGDVLKVSSNSIATAFNIDNFVANHSTENFGTANLVAEKGGAIIDLSLSNAGNYIIIGNSGNDILTGGPGNDTLTGDGGSIEPSTERFLPSNTGSSNDTFYVMAGTDTISDLSTGDAFIISSGATLNATNISDFIATSLTSNSGTANLFAGNDGATITMTNSTSGSYTITGGSGADSLTGGSGNDIFTGADGSDTLTGGNGDDSFNVEAGTDTISDLSTGDAFIISSGATLNATNISD